MADVPATVHQIWIGTAKAPTDWLDTLVEFCQNYGYRYRLWGNDDVEPLFAAASRPMLRAAYEDSKSWAGKADILRLLILWNEGGTYVDADSAVVNGDGLDRLLDYNSRRGTVLFGAENDDGLVANGTISAPPRSAFIGACLNRIERDYAADPDAWRKQQAWHSTGPFLVTAILNDNPNRASDGVVVVPRTVFYPYDWHTARPRDFHKTAAFPPEAVLHQYGFSTNKTAFGSVEANATTHWGLAVAVVAFLATVAVVVAVFVRRRKRHTITVASGV
jgi:mannosyltransferase OCH1-like enzyme